jgi:hypothetical protein
VKEVISLYDAVDELVEEFAVTVLLADHEQEKLRGLLLAFGKAIKDEVIRTVRQGVERGFDQ